tara:strand:- start:94 stop:471 length:378 start_codon:yes stop_codon:yes gene_type:complete
MTQFIIENKTHQQILADEADALLDNMLDEGLQNSNNFEDMLSVRDLLIDAGQADFFPLGIDLSSSEEWQFEIVQENAEDGIEIPMKIAILLDMPIEKAVKITANILEICNENEGNNILGFQVQRS